MLLGTVYGDRSYYQNPMKRLQKEMNRIFQRYLGDEYPSPTAVKGAQMVTMPGEVPSERWIREPRAELREFSPYVDIKESDRQYTMLIDLPGTI